GENNQQHTIGSFIKRTYNTQTRSVFASKSGKYIFVVRSGGLHRNRKSLLFENVGLQHVISHHLYHKSGYLQRIARNGECFPAVIEEDLKKEERPSCLACVLLCQIEGEEIGFARNGNKDFKYLANLFRGDKCGYLNEKPKLFFIQVGFVPTNKGVDGGLCEPCRNLGAGGEPRHGKSRGCETRKNVVEDRETTDLLRFIADTIPKT
uniref:Caspase family p20 domain-containing protein n=1 Tax=Eptatretus burgeri TaxID=7764 RepID=A0A8C4N8B4_EPTBU